MTTAKRVPLEVIEARLKTCSECEYERTRKDVKYCGLGCGCQVTPRKSMILKSLAEVEENLPKWGCMHPQRPNKGWKQ